MESWKRNIVIAIIVATFLAAIEGTIVSIAVPTIVKSLNGFELISRVFSLYLLAAAVSTPIYGKLSDLYGRKNILIIGLLIFLTGSILCGFSSSILQLIIFRSVQGLGAGSIFTVTYTIIGDIFDLEEKAKIQGLVSTVWGVASLVGPFLGGFLIDVLSWHWIFFINIPFGIVTIIMLQKNFKESFIKTQHKIDFPGAIVISLAIVILLEGVLNGHPTNTKGIVVFSLNFFAFVTLLFLFYFIEKRAKEPIIDFEIFTHSNILVNALSFVSSTILIGMNVYIPIYIQGVLGYDATISGLASAPIAVSWLLSSVLIAKAIVRYNAKPVIIASALILLFSTFLFSTMGIASPIVLILIFSLIIGFGFGGSINTTTIIIQTSVNYEKRGMAVASNTLLRSLGQSIGVSIFGVIFNSMIISYFTNAGISGVEPNNLYSSVGKVTGLTPEHVSASINTSVHMIFLVLIVLSAVSLALAFLLPRINMGKE